MAPKAKPPKRGKGRLRLAELVAGLSGARLCYGEPVEAGARSVVPVARVRARGGGRGSGMGGVVEAEPVGFLEVGPEGARFEPIAAPGHASGRLQVALAGVAVVAAAAGAARLFLSRRG